MNDDLYFSLDKVLSRNGMFNLVVGPRGNGKTYAAKKLAISKALSNGDEFIYLRRYTSELKNIQNWFGDVAQEFPDWEFRVNGRKAEAKLKADSDNKDVKWTLIGYFVQLSKGQQFKSVPFPKVKWIIFDEFIIERGHVRYLPDEVRSFLDFYSTVDRWQDRVRVVMLGNTISTMNPYFLEWDIRPDENVEFVTRNNGFIVCQFTNSELFRDSVYQTRFGQFIKESEYGDYSVDGDFLDNSDMMVGIKGSNYYYAYTIVTKQGKFSVWFEPGMGNAHVSERIPPNQTEFVLDHTLMTPDTVLIDFSSHTLSIVRGLFARGNVTFSSSRARNLFYELWRKHR